jgi:hypothetical protein
MAVAGVDNGRLVIASEGKGRGGNLKLEAGPAGAVAAGVAVSPTPWCCCATALGALLGGAGAAAVVPVVGAAGGGGGGSFFRTSSLWKGFAVLR